MSEQIPIDSDAVVDITQSAADGLTQKVTKEVAFRRLAIVNVVFVGPAAAADRQWVLIDAGIPGTAAFIERAAKERFGKDSRPSAIMLTHGHFDHVGGLQQLAKKWNVPIYAHDRELPYLNGSAAYPPPDPSVGGGLMARLSPLFPTGPINLGPWLQPFPADGTLPNMPGWQWIHTPGHSAGHVSFWRAADRTLISGDAFITTNQESAYSVAMYKPEIHGPPMYFTANWEEARESVRKLASLKPETVVSGHGPALQGPEMQNALQLLADDFDRIAVPEKGRYVSQRM